MSDVPSRNDAQVVEPPTIPGSGQVRIAVVGAGINRADILQKAGTYALPPGVPEVLGLEVSGTVVEVGEGVEASWLGKDVVALLPGGGYSPQVVTDVATILPVPAGVDVLAAGGLIEGAATVVSNVVMAGSYSTGETVLIHGGTGGVGAFAVQLLSGLGARVAVTASSNEKLEAARSLGASILINYRSEDFVERLQAEGGADIILDTVGGQYLQPNLEALSKHGRILTIGMQGGSAGELNFSMLMKKQASISGTMLRSRTLEEKRQILQKTHEVVWPLLASGDIDITPAKSFPLAQVEQAHAYFTRRDHTGKVVLDCRQS